METGNNDIHTVKHNLKLIFYLSDCDFSYAIFNTSNHCFEKIKTHKIQHGKHEFHNQISNIIELDNDLKYQYKVTLGAIDNSISTFIPDVLFDKNNLKQYIELTYGNKDTNKTHKYVKQQFTNCYSVFTINNNLLTSLNSHFHNLKIKPSGSVLVDYGVNLNQSKKRQLLTYINKRNFHIVLISNGKFEFYNQFHFENDDDFIYYFMNCMRILDIENDNTQVNIMSELDKKNILFTKLQKHIELSFINRPSQFLYTDEIIQKSPHQYHNIFSQLICE